MSLYLVSNLLVASALVKPVSRKIKKIKLCIYYIVADAEMLQYITYKQLENERSTHFSQN